MALHIRTKPLADAQLEAHAILCPRQIRQGALVMAVNALGRGGAELTQRRGRGGSHREGDLMRRLIDLIGVEVQPGSIG
jgi:hypothetical protein